MIKLTESLYEKFLSNVEIKGKCWIWKAGARNSDDYGGVQVGGSWTSAHRLAVTLFLDPEFDPTKADSNEGHVLHDCDTPRCVSPHCIKVGNRSQNMLDMYRRGRVDISKKVKAMHSAESRAKVSAVLTGRKRGPLSAEHRANIRAGMGRSKIMGES
jgi:hypothetical protein